VAPTFIWRSINHEAQPVENGGISSRDFIFVEDMARGLVACALKGEPGEVYNLASGVETRILELARLINELTGSRTPVDLRPGRDWDRSGKRFGSTKKSRINLGFEAKVPLRDGLQKTIEWTRANRDVIQRCISQHDYFMARML
jgi:nucleoside-diphosphate-sugar epimerase